jgi:hypothetical protein
MCLDYTYGVRIRCPVSTCLGSEDLSAWSGQNMDSTPFLCGLISESNQTDNLQPMKKTIGQMIKEELERQGRTKVWFAKSINRSDSTCYNIFNNNTIDTELLKVICKVLSHDFFKDLSEELNNQ